MPEFTSLVLLLFKVVLLAMVVERAMVLLFEWRWYERTVGGWGLKVPITYIVAAIICFRNKFDVFQAILGPEKSGEASDMGMVLTAAVVAGGSAGAITLFQGVLKMTKSAQKDAGLLPDKP